MDSLELLAAFETAAAFAQAEWDAQETEADRIDRAARQKRSDAFFDSLSK